MHWEPGQIIGGGRYKIIDELGYGGFATTYKAEHCELGSFCAIKALNGQLHREPQYPKFVKRFRDEGRRLAALAEEKHHPHIVGVLDLFREPHKRYGEIDCLVMDFIPGNTLEREVYERGQLPEAEAVRYVQQVGSALVEVHQRDLVHWDANPKNIMIRLQKEAVLIDFGIAGDCPPTSFSRKFGNEAFAPYEQFLKGVREKQCDIYTLGASLYYAVTQEVPTFSSLRKLDNEPLIAPTEYASISSQVNDAIMWAMALEPEDRPTSMEEWLQCFAPSVEEDDLSSEKGVDYRRLRDLLQAQQWGKADRETGRRMLEVAGMEEKGWLDVEALQNFARIDLHTIDQLWVKYSNGRFGFSVQKDIWLDLGGKLGEYDYEIFQRLGDRAGWRKNSLWLRYSSHTFHVLAPRGHFPRYWGSPSALLRAGGCISSLFLRLQ